MTTMTVQERDAILSHLRSLAAAQPLGTCPIWCIGATQPQHDQWTTDGSDEFARRHVNVAPSDEILVHVEQYEYRRGGESVLEPAGIIVCRGRDDELTAAEARQVVSDLLNAAELLEQIGRTCTA